MLRPLLLLPLLFRSILAQGNGTVGGMPTISVKGAKFFTSDGAQFFIKGMDGTLVLRLMHMPSLTGYSGRWQVHDHDDCTP